MIVNLKNLFSNPYDLIVLNRPGLSSTYKNLYKNASKILWTDGAANKLYEELNEEVLEYLPNTIVGDMDSINPEISSYFSNVPQMKIDNCDNTDLDKALDLCDNKTIIALTDHSGRLDHLIGAFSSILKYNPESQVFLYNPTNLAFIIRKLTIINAENWEYCGIIPLLGNTRVTTTGLKWNLNGDFTSFDGLLSTCNGFTGEASIESSFPVLFTISK